MTAATPTNHENRTIPLHLDGGGWEGGEKYGFPPTWIFHREGGRKFLISSAKRRERCDAEIGN